MMIGFLLASALLSAAPAAVASFHSPDLTKVSSSSVRAEPVEALPFLANVAKKGSPSTSSGQTVVVGSSANFNMSPHQGKKLSPTLHVTQTYLRATPGKRAALVAYIKQNWFAMDRIGIEQGLFTSYALMERADDSEADWDVIVAVGYPTVQGHDAPGVSDAFKAIRAAHRETKIDGLGLKELGTIVRHYPLTLAVQGQ